jgi:hypothetical protein
VEKPGPVTFVFSEPMDPNSVVLPNKDNSNPDRSYEGAFLFEDQERPAYAGGTSVDVLENGRIIEITGSHGLIIPILHIFKNGFRNLNGEPLDRDYTISNIWVGQGIQPDPSPMLRVTLPAPTQPTSDPSQPLSLYFTGGTDPFSMSDSIYPGVKPETLQVELRAGPDGSPIQPLSFTGDIPVPTTTKDPLFSGGGYLHFTVQHPPLPPSPRPYFFRITSVNGIMADPIFFRHQFSFTVGPALAGDLNNDGSVAVADALLALRGSLGLASLSDAQQFAADLVPSQGVNGRPVGDGQVAVADVVKILKRAVGSVPDNQWP